MRTSGIATKNHRKNFISTSCHVGQETYQDLGRLSMDHAKQKLRRESEFLWCGREDLNLQSLARTSTSSWRVYHSATSARGLPTRRDNNRSRKKDQVSNVRSFPLIIFIPIDSTEISNRVPSMSSPSAKTWIGFSARIVMDCRGKILSSFVDLRRSPRFTSARITACNMPSHGFDSPDKFLTSSSAVDVGNTRNFSSNVISARNSGTETSLMNFRPFTLPISIVSTRRAERTSHAATPSGIPRSWASLFFGPIGIIPNTTPLSTTTFKTFRIVSSFPSTTTVVTPLSISSRIISSALRNKARREILPAIPRSVKRFSISANSFSNRLLPCIKSSYR